MNPWWWCEWLPVVRDLRAVVANLEREVAGTDDVIRSAHDGTQRARAETIAANARAAEALAECTRLRALLDGAMVRDRVTGRLRRWEAQTNA